MTVQLKPLPTDDPLSCNGLLLAHTHTFSPHTQPSRRPAPSHQPQGEAPGSLAPLSALEQPYRARAGTGLLQQACQPARAASPQPPSQQLPLPLLPGCRPPHGGDQERAQAWPAGPRQHAAAFAGKRPAGLLGDAPILSPSCRLPSAAAPPWQWLPCQLRVLSIQPRSRAYLRHRPVPLSLATCRLHATAMRPLEACPRCR